MIKFITNTVLYALFIIFCSFAIDYAISNGLLKMKDYRFQSWKEIANDNINAEILVIGNSRALSHFNSSIIDSITAKKTYNIGFGGHPFRQQLLKYNFYLKHNNPPKIIILNVDYASFVKTEIIGHEREQVFPLISDSYLKSELQFHGYSLNERYFPLYRYFGYQQVIKNGLLEFFRISNYQNKTLEKGYLAELGNWNGEELRKISKLEFITDSSTLNLFETFMFDCKRKSIKVFLVHSPIYKGAMDKLVNKKAMHDYFKYVAKKYNTKYLDYSNHSLCNDTLNFVVSVHLNDKAAKQFSIVLANDLISLNK